jgi:hypothetical protein
MEAGGTHCSRIECVPFMAAGAEPFVFLAWRPPTQWAPDARARWIVALFFVYFTIQNDGGFGGVTQENASPLARETDDSELRRDPQVPSIPRRRSLRD